MKNYQIVTDSTGVVRVVDTEKDQIIIYIDLENEYIEVNDERFNVDNQ